MDLTLGSGWPYGGPHIPITQAAGKLRCERLVVPQNQRRVPMPAISAGEKLLAVFLAPGDPNSFAAASAREITDIREGAVWLPADLHGPQALLLFIASRTGMMVKRPALEAEGFVLDHYDRAAVENHLKFVGDRMMQAFGSNPPRAIFCDSLEVYGSDWTGDLLEEFRKRRGYDLEPYLPALVGDIGEKTGAIRHDWGMTLMRGPIGRNPHRSG